MPARSPRKQLPTWVWPTALAVAVFIVFASACGGEFLVWDDRTHLHDNPHLGPPQTRDLGYFWQQPYWGMYVPVTYTFWGWLAMLSERLAPPDGPRLSPALFHAANVALHVAATLLVFRLLRRVGAADWTAAVGAGLFGLHPLQVEAVAWVSEARGLLAAVFGLAAADQFLALADGRRIAIRYTCATLLFTAALLAKSSAAAVPLMLVVLTTAAGRWRWPRTALALLPWFGIAAVVLLLTKEEQTDAAFVDAGAWWQRPLVAADAISFYLRKLFVPWPLLFDYGRTPTKVLAGDGVWLSALTVVAVSFVCARPRLRAVALPAWLLFIAGLAPVLGFVAFTFQATSTTADRYAYLAMLGPAWGAAIGLSRLGRPSRAVYAVIGGVLALCAALSFVQLRVWRDDVTLFTHELAYRPDSKAARYNLAHHYALVGDDDAAERWYHATLELAPNDRETLIGLGNLALAGGDAESGAKWLARAVAAYPFDGELRNNLGVATAMTGRIAEAETEFRRAVELTESSHAEFLVNHGRALAALGRNDEAAQAFRRALELDPANETARHELAALGN